jgi:hypothetical protein
MTGGGDRNLGDTGQRGVSRRTVGFCGVGASMSGVDMEG